MNRGPLSMDFITNSRQRAIAELVYAGFDQITAKLVVGKARTLTALAIAACNRTLTDKEDKRKIDEQYWIIKLVTPYGVTVNYGGDPRGFVVKLQFPNGESNSWGNDGWGIA